MQHDLNNETSSKNARFPYILNNSHISAFVARWFYIQIFKPHANHEKIFYQDSRLELEIRPISSSRLLVFLDDIKKIFRRCTTKDGDNLFGSTPTAFWIKIFHEPRSTFSVFFSLKSAILSSCPLFLSQKSSAFLD